ncbi:protein of unknown function [Candidatus Hydrogenisulfobacillus filiaventi]|uniref:Uncharacterized protein n=1 Tax=Candidatus Hydrogenisulfobacillus filiaventi TaxID=2707344 RepID=A0A6F8ZIZ6_9FIRM|nr:protein of unknown function [Candidatus Hydrogenisulfobacillus filiaventi]
MKFLFLYTVACFLMETPGGPGAARHFNLLEVSPE